MGQGLLFQKAMARPRNYKHLTEREQWAIDKRLGILDWDGSCPHMSGAPCPDCEKKYHQAHPLMTKEEMNDCV
jgi:hypothetical protein